jgi:methylase of polypeptide subunit release factors
VFEKGAAAVAGAIETVAGIFVEAAKEAVDLAQINLHILTLGKYQPTLISDMAKAAEQAPPPLTC